MRGIFVLSVLLFLCVQSYAQKIRFNDTANRWYTCITDPERGPFKPTHKHAITHVDSFDGFQYFFHERFDTWVREDATGEIFYSKKHPDSAETVFMDFTLEPGDTLYVHPHSGAAILMKIDSVAINGVYHKLQRLSDFDILEGIGPQFGRIHLLHYPFLPLCCFENNGARVTFSTKPWYYLDCALSVADVQKANAQVYVFPNPLTPDSRIILPQLAEIAKLKIVNTAGQRVVDKTLKHVREIPLGEYELPAGVYFYTVKDAKLQDAYKGKFTVR